MEGVLVIILSVVVLVLAGLVVMVARLARPTTGLLSRSGRSRWSLPAIGPEIRSGFASVDVGGGVPAVPGLPGEEDEEPTVRVLPPSAAERQPAADEGLPVADEGLPVAEAAQIAAGDDLERVDPAGPADPASGGGQDAAGGQVLARAEREAQERLARAEREAAEIRRRGAEEVAALRDRVRAQAAAEAERLEAASRDTVRAEAEAARVEAAAIRAEQRLRADALDAREQRLAQRVAELDEQASRLADRSRELHEQEAELTHRVAEADGRDADRQRALERIAGLTAVQARAELVTSIEQDTRREAALRVREIEARAEEEGEQRARRIVTTAIQRVASEQTTESVVTVLALPGDDMKGRIIGREGRNIRTFESVTGVNVLIDDTPEAVLLSCFDPVRREIGRITLAALVADGRIHPHRIEEEYARAQVEVEARCVRAGEDALVETGVSELHPELIVLLGRLRYRTSYGQNVLAHLIESAHLAGIMAAELQMELPLAKRAALLHDLGKALTHEAEGSHALVGADVARRHGESEEVVHAIEAHHNEVAPRSLCAVLTQAADQISGGRPGARRASLESYVQRLERIERIAGDRPGVDRVFAMQAGREVRVMVVPEEVDDAAAHLLARDVARQIEDELTYPGQIRVTVVRETRAVGTAR
ncbi:ribonuclease Y [Frankia sp. R82]|uniref:ribonuclease Y n=1 Tax=Frankia sp. R82 TaxID=2950553 RepID=UPI0020442C77|nr:ribonuclease Y [Frankia sp. R82]MCM3885360.1 ribonuclease Y [Frankia sp. R82]